MKRYGIPYTGSKNKIADFICDNLPSGERLVDLFAGGGAVTHCATTKKKWNYFLFNDLDKRTIEAFKRAIKGDYDFKWVTREEFHEKKKTDGIIAFCWSFGNDGCNYLYGKNIEKGKKQLHDYLINNSLDINDKTLKFFDFNFEKKETLEERKKEYSRFKKYVKTLSSRCDKNIDSLLELQNFVRLQNLESLKNLGFLRELKNSKIMFDDKNYLEYEYKKGDIVYCDIPYENCFIRKGTYLDGSFNHKEFYDWAISRNYSVYFSSYDNISDNRFIPIAKIEKKVTLCATNNSIKKIEVLYWNGVKNEEND